MKFGDARSIVDLIRDAKASELFIVSFVVLPLILSVWAYVFKQFELIEYLEGTVLFAVLITLYISSILYMKISDSKSEKIRRDADMIIHELQSIKRYSRLRYETVRKRYNVNFTDNYLEEMIKTFPDELEKSKVDAEDGNKKDCIGLKENSKEKTTDN